MKEIKRLVELIHAPTEVKETYLTDLVFPACSRLPNIFSLNGLRTVKDLMDFGTRGLYGFKNFGRKSLSQLEEALGTLGVVLPTEGPRTPLRQRAKQQPLFTS
jgi:DNA-directed RNA polymerase alpha subunit